MKINYCLLLCYATLLSTYTHSCPTCVGRVSRQSAPFFSDVCYCNKSKSKSRIAPRPIKLNTNQTTSNKK